MSVFSYHLVKASYASALRAILSPPSPKNTPGLVHAESMLAMTLGSPVFSPSRILLNQIAVFAQWDNEDSIDRYLEVDAVGRLLSKGWHTRLTFRRQWGSISGFKIPVVDQPIETSNAPVVAVTLARMKMF